MRKIISRIRLLAVAFVLLPMFSCDTELPTDRPLPYKPDPTVDVTSINNLFTARYAERYGHAGSQEISDFFRGFHVRLEHGNVICTVNGLETWQNITEWKGQTVLMQNVSDQNTMELSILSLYNGGSGSGLDVQLIIDAPGFDFLPEGMNAGLFDVRLSGRPN